MVESRERRTARFQVLPVRIKQSGTERLGYADPAIVGRTAAERDDDRPRPVIQRMPNQLTRAERTSVQRVARLLVHVLQAAGTRHLYHGDTPGFDGRRAPLIAAHIPDASRTVGMQCKFGILCILGIGYTQQTILCTNRPHERIVDHRAAASPADGSQQHVQRAFSPISHRRDIATRRRTCRLYPARDRTTRRHGIKRPLERIHRNEQPHGSSLR